MKSACIVALLLTVPAAAIAQQPTPPSGDAVFARACASCHQATPTQAGQTKVPTPDELRAYTPEAIVNALTNGKMAAQGAVLTTADRVAVAQFLTGRTFTVSTNRAVKCTAATPTADPMRGPRWMAWGGDATNTRYAAQGGLTAQDLPKLKLKWAFAYDGATSARVQPALAGGKLFAGSDNGELNALDPKTGCTYWTYKAESGIRSALSVWPYRSGTATRYAVFFGDGKANVYAVDAITGQLVWKRKADEHPNAAITGAIAVADGKAFVPIQGLGEETSAGRGDNTCCTFRGNLTALDVNTGAVLWKTYTVDEPKPRGKNARNGTDAFGPAGGGIWSSPTVDLARRSVYFATGNGYADPIQPMTDSVVAVDMQTGKVKWFYQGTKGDSWLGGCPEKSTGSGCPEVSGPDHDFSAAPMLATINGRQLIVIPQKSGVAHAINPDTGAMVWQYRFGEGSALGGQWGGTVDGRQAYFGNGSYRSEKPGGVRAVQAGTGQQAWNVEAPPVLCAGQPRCNASQAGAATAIPGAVIAGSIDGGLRAYAADGGEILWQFDTNRRFETVNGVPGTGASIDGSPLIVGGGMIFVNSGYGGIAARPGNVLLAFGVD
jgi:polyvinyl alcohol dehydrogenase (cytochrome)